MLDNTTVMRTSAVGASQVELELLYSSSQLIPTLRQDFRDMFEGDLNEAEVLVDFGVDLMVQIYLHKRTTISMMVGLLMHHFDDQEEPAQACADAIHHAITKDVLDCVPTETISPWGEVIEGFELVCKFHCRPEVQRRIDQFQYPLPMILPPREVSSNRHTGYLTIPGSIILKKNHHEEDVCLDHINRVNEIPLSINQDVLAFIQNSWKHLDKRKPDEEMEEFRKRKRAFLKYDQVSRDVLTALLEQGNRFWLTHRYDKRGRTYCQGYHCTYQGNAWNKAVIEFADAEPLNEE